MSRTTRLVGQQDGTAGTKIKVVVIEFLLVERREPVHNVEGAAGRLKLQCGVAEVASSVRDIEVAIRDKDINIAGAVRSRPIASLPDTAACAICVRCVRDGLVKIVRIESQQPAIE